MKTLNTEVIVDSIRAANEGKTEYLLQHKKTGLFMHYLGKADVKSKYSSAAIVVVRMPDCNIIKSNYTLVRKTKK